VKGRPCFGPDAAARRLARGFTEGRTSMLIERIFQLRHRLVFRLILAVGFTLLV
jgi:hypothetical protein